jgi:formate dehydrogenase major subunit
MALVKLEIDGKRVIADSNQTVLQVARHHGIGNIPTLCHDEQLEPFASCFLCVVKVKGARTLLPACATKVSNGMVVQTETTEVRQSRKAALELLLSDHYADCVGPCQIACPASVDIQGYVALAAIGKYKDAIALIKDRNPLPSVCGRVCTRPCEVKGCRRNLLDEAVGIDYIKRYLTDLDLGSADSFRPDTAPLNGKRVAVVGAGPAGLSAAYFLALRGYHVDMFESQPEAGGMLRYGIPEYRLPKDVLDLEINQILSLGVTLRTNAWLGRDFTVTSLKEAGYSAIFLGIGAWRSSLMRVHGEESLGVLSGIEFLKNFGLRKKIDIHGKVAVVGGGNTAIDCARTALRLGVNEVSLLYRRTRNEMPANATEINDAIEEGVDMQFLIAPQRVLTKDGKVCGIECLRMELGEPDASGRRSPKPVRGSEFVVECDYIISAIGQSTTVADLIDGRVPGMLPLGEVLNLTRWQTIQINERTFETSVDGVFSGGDVVTGAATAIEAIAAGRKAAHAIDTYVTQGAAEPEPQEFFSRKDTFARVTVKDLRSQQPSSRRVMPMLPAEERVKSFVEVETGYTAEDMRKEVQRCLECGCVALFDCDLRRYATEYGVELKRYLGEARQHPVDNSHPLIELDPNKCVLCARCVRTCSEVVGVSAYGFANRGFSTVVGPPPGMSLRDTECVSCGLCISTCPTGAISQKIPLAKPGPWKTESVASVCHYCGVGCQVNYDTFGDTLVKVSRADENGVTFGNHCRRGRFGYNYVHASDRLAAGRIRPGREMQDAPVDEALAYAAMRLKEMTRRCSGRDIAVFVSPRLTNEEIYLAQKLARVALKTHNVTSFSHLLGPDFFEPEVLATASYRDLVDAQALLVVNSELAEEHFVVDLLGKRAIRGGGRLVFVGSEENRTARFAEIFLQCRPDRQMEVVAAVLREFAAMSRQPEAAVSVLAALIADVPAETIEERTGVPIDAVREAAQVLAKSISKVLVCNRDYRGPRLSRDTAMLAEVANLLGCGFLPLYEKANAQGLLDMGGDPRWYPGYLDTTSDEAIDNLEKEWCVALRDLDASRVDVAALLREKKIKVAIILGEDPLGCPDLPDDLREGLLATDFMVVGDLFLTETAKAANVVLPLSSAVETSGTFTNSERRVQSVTRAVRPRSGVETWDLLCQLGARMGFRFKMKYASPGEVMDEIRRVAPIYRDVAIGDGDGGAIWDRARFPLAPRPAVAARAAVMPALTLPLDHLEIRFKNWFEGLGH